MKEKANDSIVKISKETFLELITILDNVAENIVLDFLKGSKESELNNHAASLSHKHEVDNNNLPKSGYTPTQIPNDISALSTQIAGTHYKDMAIQPIEFIQKNHIGFIEGNIIKYICRYKNKNGKEDLKKVIHYVELLLELEYGEDKPKIREGAIYDNGLFRIFKKDFPIDSVWDGTCQIVDCKNGEIVYEGTQLSCSDYVRIHGK